MARRTKFHSKRHRRNPSGWKFHTERVGSAGYLGYAVNDKEWIDREVGPFPSAAAALAAAKEVAGIKGGRKARSTKKARSKARRNQRSKARSYKKRSRSASRRGRKARASTRRSRKAKRAANRRAFRARKVKTFGYGVSSRRGRPWVKRIPGFSLKSGATYRRGSMGETIRTNPRRGRRRNPGLTKHFTDGGSVHVDGSSITLLTPYGETYEYEGTGAVAKLRKAKTTSAAQKALGGLMLRSINPRRRKGRRTRRNCGRMNPHVRHRGYRFRGARSRRARSRR